MNKKGVEISFEFINARAKYFGGVGGGTKWMAQQIAGWLSHKKNGASPEIMNGLLEQVLRAFEQKDYKFFELIADALKFSEPTTMDPKYFIFLAFDNLYLKPRMVPNYLGKMVALDIPSLVPEISSDLIVEEAKRIYKEKGLQPPTGTRWYRQLEYCGLGSLLIKPRKGGRKKGTKNVL